MLSNYHHIIFPILLSIEFCQAADQCFSDIKISVVNKDYKEALDDAKLFLKGYSYMHRQFIYLKDGIISYPYHVCKEGISRKEKTGYCHELDKNKFVFSERSVEGITNFVTQRHFKNLEDFSTIFEADIKFPLDDAEKKVRNSAARILELLSRARVLTIAYNNKNPAWPIMSIQTLLQPGGQKEFTFTLPISVPSNVMTNKKAAELNIHELSKVKINSHQMLQTYIANFANKYNKINSSVGTKRDGIAEGTVLVDEPGKIITDSVTVMSSTQGLVDVQNVFGDQDDRVDSRDDIAEGTVLVDEPGKIIADSVTVMSSTQGLVDVQKDFGDQGDRVDSRDDIAEGTVLVDEPGKIIADSVIAVLSSTQGLVDVQKALFNLEIGDNSEIEASEYSQDEENNLEVFDQNQYEYHYLNPAISLQNNYDLFLQHYCKLSNESNKVDLNLRKLCFEMFILDVKSQHDMIDNWNSYLAKFSQKIISKVVIQQQGEYLLYCARQNQYELSKFKNATITPEILRCNRGLKRNIYNTMDVYQKKKYDNMARNLHNNINKVVYHLATMVQDLFAEFQKYDGHDTSKMLKIMEMDRQWTGFVNDDEEFFAVIQNSNHNDIQKLSDICSQKKNQRLSLLHLM